MKNLKSGEFCVKGNEVEALNQINKAFARGNGLSSYELELLDEMKKEMEGTDE